MAAAGPLAQRHGAGFAADLFEALAVDHPPPSDDRAKGLQGA
jgi:hypothetical protein